jgi:dTDP-4-dehydrorhamnose reductase
VKVAVIGGTGQLGRALTSELSRHGDQAIIGARTTVPTLDASVEGAVAAYLETASPDAVVYVAASTELERCEADPEQAWRLHVRGPALAARWCSDRARPILSVSSDGVFDGASGNYTELDEANPLNVYAVTKFLGEREVLARGGTVIRTNFLGPGAGSLIASLVERLEAGEMIVGYADSVISPLHVEDVAAAIRRLLHEPVEGLLHVGGRAAITKHAIAQMVCDEIGNGRVVSGATVQRSIRRPLNTSLCSDQAQTLVGIVDRGWEATVRDSVAQIRKGRQ